VEKAYLLTSFGLAAGRDSSQRVVFSDHNQFMTFTVATEGVDFGDVWTLPIERNGGSLCGRYCRPRVHRPPGTRTRHCDYDSEPSQLPSYVRAFLDRKL